jgi:hypothetical protein
MTAATTTTTATSKAIFFTEIPNESSKSDARSGDGGGDGGGDGVATKRWIDSSVARLM